MTIRKQGVIQEKEKENKTRRGELSGPALMGTWETTGLLPLKAPGVDPSRSRSADVLALQKMVGNRAVQRWLDTSSAVQSIRSLGNPSQGTLQRDGETERIPISEKNRSGNEYKQTLLLNKTEQTLNIALGVNWVKEGTWASDDVFKKYTNKVKDESYKFLDKKYKLEALPQAKPELPTFNFPITALIYDFPSGYTIRMHGGLPGSNSSAGSKEANFYEKYDPKKDIDTKFIVFAHEFGHCLLGQTDEYASKADPNRPVYKDDSMMGNFWESLKKGTTPEFKIRHFEHVATEVAKAMPGYKCTIKNL